MKLFLISFGTTVIFTAYLAASAWNHRRLRDAVPIRVHVSGTRGKSSTVRLVAAGLRSRNLKVVAKTTGTSPRLILPDGTEEPWQRRGPASIREQFRFMRRARALQAEAVVVEGMAIKPDLVWAFEHYFMNSTVTVITNVRQDHAEELGTAADAVARSLREAIGRNSRLVLTAEAATPLILQRAESLRVPVTVVPTRQLPALGANREVALAVCELLGASREGALQAMSLAGSDPGAFQLAELQAGPGGLRFANAFAINDGESFRRLWDETYAREGNRDGTVAAAVLFSIRGDRPLRTLQFLEVIRSLPASVTLFLHHHSPLTVHYVRWQALRRGFKRDLVRTITSTDVEDVVQQLAAATPAGAITWGAGNYRGLGEKMISWLEEAGRRC